MVNNVVETTITNITKTDERRAFLLLAVFLAPILACAIVGGFGFTIWMLQLVFGPPTG